jgi:hypothetical protein
MPEAVFPALRSWVGICAAASTISLSASPQQPGAATAASRFALALVNDARGKPIVDIGDDDFVVQEGSTPRDVLSVRVADYPVVLVVDNGVSALPDFSAIKAAVKRLVERLGPRPLAIVTTTGEPRLVASFDDDREALTAAAEALEAPALIEGKPLAAAAFAARTLASTGTLFSTIVLVTASPLEARAAAADELIAPIIDSRAVLHIVANERFIGNDGAILRGLAQQTHGEYTAIFASPSYTPALERIAVRLTSEMLIEYIVPVGSRAVDPKIGVRIPGARVRGLGVAPR